MTVGIEPSSLTTPSLHQCACPITKSPVSLSPVPPSPVCPYGECLCCFPFLFFFCFGVCPVHQWKFVSLHGCKLPGFYAGALGRSSGCPGGMETGGAYLWSQTTKIVVPRILAQSSVPTCLRCVLHSELLCLVSVSVRGRRLL